VKGALIFIGRILVAHYDKLIALFVVIALGYSVAACVVGMRAAEQRRGDFRQWLVSLEPPLYPTNDVVDLGPFNRALVALGDPVQIEDDARVFTPGLRITCEECRWPKPYNVFLCPHCGFRTDTNMPKAIADVDLDLMDDEWEKKYRLNPRDPEDADRDPDDDGFTNLEEHNAASQSNPKDARSHPPLVAKFCVAGVRRIRFPLQFKAVNDYGIYKQFQLNHVKRRQTFLVKMGGTVSGYKVVAFEPKKVKREQSGLLIEVDVSVLTLEKDGKRIELVKDTEAEYFLHMAKILFQIDGSRYSAQEGGVIDLKGPQYKSYRFRLKGVDSRDGSIVIEDLQTSETFPLRRCAE